jgi:hypothetical protein
MAPVQVSNREPYVHRLDGEEIVYERPVSGLITAREPVMQACGGTWVAHGSGDADRDVVDPHDRIEVPPEHPQSGGATFASTPPWMIARATASGDCIRGRIMGTRRRQSPRRRDPRFVASAVRGEKGRSGRRIRTLSWAECARVSRLAWIAALVIVVSCGDDDQPGASADSVVSTVPAHQAMHVRLSPPIEATFDRDVLPATLDESTFVVAGVSGTVSYDARRRTAIFKPRMNLAAQRTYAATITAGVQDLNGRPITPGHSWVFTTGEVAAITPLLPFNGTNGADPKGSLTLVNVQSPAGQSQPYLFGRTAIGGASNAGVIFALPLSTASPTPAVYSFTTASSGQTSGCQPHHDSMTLLGTTLYGAALFDGPECNGSGAGNGTLFAVNPVALADGMPGAAYSSFHSLQGAPTEGANSHSCMAVGSDNETLYGTTALGNNTSDGNYTGCDKHTPGCGTIYSVTSGGPLQVLYSFQNGATAAPTPSATLPPPMPTGSPGFACATCTGSVPHGRVTVVNIGTQSSPLDVLLGITRQGGLITNGNSDGNGVLYAVIPAATPPIFVPLHYFLGAPADAAYTDHGNVVLGEFIPASASSPAQVTIFGMTTQGGSGTITDSAAGPTAGAGAIFTALVTLPEPPLLPGSSGYTILHNFAPTSTSTSNPPAVADLVNGGLVPDGYNPYGSLLLVNGWLYGMTRNGGVNGGGVIFLMSPDPSCAGSLAAACYGILASFDTQEALGKKDCPCDPQHPTPTTCNMTGSAPIDNLIPNADSSLLYGMTQTGGANDLCNENGYGTVFSIDAIP